MKRILLISAILTLALSVGCRKVMDPTAGGTKVELKFATPVKVNAETEVLSRATTEALPDNTPITVKVLAAGGTDFTKAILEAEYLASRDGYAVPKTENDRIFLPPAKYDIYFILPQSSVLTDTGVVTIGNGVDFMAVKKTITVDVTNATEGSQTVDVVFEHFVSAIKLKVVADKYINSLTVKEVRILDLPKGAVYDLPKALMTIENNATGSATLTDADFTSTGIADQTVIEQKRQYEILPSILSVPRLEVDVEINGVARKVLYDFVNPTKAGLVYQVNLTVNAQGTATKWDITLAPWVSGAAVDGGTASENSIFIGQWRDGGIVFWIDPTDSTYYKVVDAGERTAINWQDAQTYASDNGKSWYLPDVEELKTIYNLRKGAVGTSVLDKAIAEHFGRPIVSNYYWSSSKVSASSYTAVDLTSGVEATKNITGICYARAVKASKQFLNYTTTPANCYVSYPKGNIYQTVQFNALKRPVAKYVQTSSTIANAQGTNSALATDGALSDDIVFQSGDKLEVVWQTAVGHATGGSMVVKSVSLASDGVATVEVNGVGNAVLAYKRGSTILWNYHIWVTDSNPFVTHATANTSGNVNGTAEGGAQAKFMDRNLGALSATTAKPSTTDAPKYFGLLYQYGRTTPFTGQGSSITLSTYPQLYDKNGNEIAMNNIGGFTLQANIAVDNVTTAVQNPMNCYTQYATWNRIGTGAVWNDYGVNKSIYDPCPYGYRVPKTGSWNGFTAQSFPEAINGGLVVFGTWWPATGFRWSGSFILNQVGSYGEYWASSANMPEDAYSLEFGDTSSALNTKHILARATGMAVRCVQEGY